jgi:hypothetical protein
MIAELREVLETNRRRRLHAQIGALTTQINVMAARNLVHERTKFYRLLAKKKRLERELAQPMLLPLDMFWMVHKTH